MRRKRTHNPRTYAQSKAFRFDGRQSNHCIRQIDQSKLSNVEFSEHARNNIALHWVDMALEIDRGWYGFPSMDGRATKNVHERAFVPVAFVFHARGIIHIHVHRSYLSIVRTAHVVTVGTVRVFPRNYRCDSIKINCLHFNKIFSH